MAATRIAVWDLPTRIFHWAIVALVAFSWWSAENHDLERHRWSGYAILGLLVFRLIWGFVGSSTARFSSFVRGPRAFFAHARGEGEPVVGHNPMGGWSVVALLLLLVAQVSLGLFAVDHDGLESGPLAHLVSFDTGREVAEVHELLFKVLLAFIVLHVGAILFYLFVRRDNLILPMIRGKKEVEVAPATAPRMASPLTALLVAVVAVAIMWWVSKGLPLP